MLLSELHFLSGALEATKDDNDCKNLRTFSGTKCLLFSHKKRINESQLESSFGLHYGLKCYCGGFDHVWMPGGQQSCNMSPTPQLDRGEKNGSWLEMSTEGGHPPITLMGKTSLTWGK